MNEPEALQMMITAVLRNNSSDGRLSIDLEKIDFLFELKPGSEIIRRIDDLRR